MARAFNAFTSKLRRWLGDSASQRANRQEKRKLPAKPVSRRLAMEHLEDRVVPAVDYATMASEFTARLDSVSAIVKSAAEQSTAVLPILGDSFARQATDAEKAVLQLKTKLDTVIRKLKGNDHQAAIRTTFLNSGLVRDLGTNGVDGADILIPDAEYKPKDGSITITMRLGTNLTVKGKNFNFDLGLPGVPFGLTGNSSLSVGVDVDYDRLTFGMKNGSFFVETVRTNTLTVALTATANDTNLDGTIGFFQVTGEAMKLPNGQSSNLPTAQISAGLTFNANGLTITSPRLTGSAAVNMHLDAAIRSTTTDMTFPHMTTDFQMRWNLGGAHNVSNRNAIGSAPTVEFNNIQFGLGSFLGSMLKPIAEIITEASNPLGPVYDLMKTRLPGLSDLSEAIGAGPVTLDKLAGAVVGSGALPPDYQLLADLSLKLHTLVSLIRDAKFGEKNDILIPVGSFNLSSVSDLRTATLTNGLTSLKQWAQAGINNLSLKSLTALVPVATGSLETIQQKINTGNLPDEARDAVQKTFKHINEQLRKLENGIGLTFPLLDNPVSIYKLLLGQDVDFVRFDAKFFGTASQTIPLPVWGPISAEFTGAITVQAEFHAGVDTYGLRTFFMDIAAGKKADPAKLADGLWIDSSKELARINGSIDAKAGVDQAFGAGVQLFAFAGISGSVRTPDDIVVTFVDIDRNNRAPGDNRLRPTKPGAVGGALFRVQGSLTAQFDFLVQAGVRVNLLFTTVEKKIEVYRKNIANIVLFDTSNRIDIRNPIKSRVPVASKIDVIYDVNKTAGANDGRSDTIRARFTDNYLRLYFNGVLTDTYKLNEVNSLKIVGSDDDERITIEGLSRAVKVDGGRGHDDLEFDDSASTGANPIYVLSDIIVARFHPSVYFLTYENIESLFVQGSNAPSTYYFNPMSKDFYSVIAGGDSDDKFYFGSGTKTLDGMFNYINVVNGGGGFNSLYLNDSSENRGNGRHAAYGIGHENVTRSTSVTFDSERLGPVTYEESYQTLDFSNIGHLELRATGNGNTIVVADSPDTRDENYTPSPMTIDVYSGVSVDDVRVLATTSALSIFGENGSDVVTVGGPTIGTRGIRGDVDITNFGGYTTLNVDDADTTQGRSIYMNRTTGGRGYITGFTETALGGSGQSRITYKANDVAAVNVKAGSGNDTISVANTVSRGSSDSLPTTISTGEGFNGVYVGGTTGDLTIDAAGFTGIVIGAALPNQPGILSIIKAPVTLRGRAGGLSITDSGSSASASYTLDASHFSRTNLRTGVSSASVYYDQLSMYGFDVTMANANGGNTFTIDGTPTLLQGFFIPSVSVFTGSGSDIGKVRGTNGPLSLDLGAGSYQSVEIGDATHSLDAIRGSVAVYGGGFINASVSNAASTVSQKATLTALTTPFSRSQTVNREVWNGDHWDTLNTINFAFLNPSSLSYTAGQVGDEIHVRGTLLNVPATLNSGAGQDHFHIDADQAPLLSPVNVVGNRSTLDVAYYHDFNTTTPQSYTLDRQGGKNRVARGGTADVFYSGLMQLIPTTARNGGNQVSVRDIPADLRADLFVADNDAVTVGRPTPMGGGFIGGNMNPIQGLVTVTGGQEVSLVLDDIAGQGGRNATLQPGKGSDADSITGMGPGEVRWNLDATSSIDIRGGRFNDTFAINGVFEPAIHLDGGAGTNTLDYSSYVDNVSGPVSWYRGEFDFSDSAGGHDGTGMNGIGFVETGISGAGFYFDGIDDSVVIPHHADLAPTALTLVARVGPNALDGNRVIVSKYDDSGSGGVNRSWELSAVDGYVRFGVYQGTEGRVIQTTDAAIGTDSSWHIAATFDPVSGAMRIYFDGQEVSTSVVEGYDEPVTTINQGTSPVRIGARVVDGVIGSFWSGAIDDVRIYARALNAAEVQASFEAGSDTLPAASTPGVRVHLPLGTATGLDGGIARIQNVIGSPFDDILVGNGGNILSGGAGRDILIAGRSPSTLLGGDGEDILIGGFLYADDSDGEMNPGALEALAAEWSRLDVDYATRSSTLQGLLAGSLIRNSGPNGLFGQGDSDLFFASGVDLGDWSEGEVRVTG